MEPEVNVTQDEKTFALLIHVLSLFFGIFAPLIIWLIKKDSSSFVDAHGKEAVNFQISIIIYSIVATILTMVFIGILLFVAIGIFYLIVVIMATVKAANGEYYRYPLTIRFIK